MTSSSKPKLSTLFSDYIFCFVGSPEARSNPDFEIVLLKGLKRKIKAHGGKVVGSLLFEVGTSMVVLTDLKERERVEKVFLRQKVEKSDLVSFCWFCEMGKRETS